MMFHAKDALCRAGPEMTYKPALKKFKEISGQESFSLQFQHTNFLETVIGHQLELPPEMANSIKVILSKIVLLETGSHYQPNFQPSEPCK